MPPQEFDHAHFALTQDQQPNNPGLSADIQANNPIPTIYFAGQRVATGPLLIGIPEIYRSTSAVLVDGFGYGAGPHHDDLEIQIRAIAHPLYGVYGSRDVIITFMDGRDDQDNREGPLYLKFYIDHLRQASGLEVLQNVALWDGHSQTELQCLQQIAEHVIPLTAARLLASHLNPGSVDGVVSPDLGAIWRNKLIAEMLGVPLFFLKKTRIDGLPKMNDSLYSVDENGYINEHNFSVLRGMNIVQFDDMIDSGRTCAEAWTILKNSGVKKINYLVTHLLGTNPQVIIRAFNNKSVDRIITTNSLPSSSSIYDPINPSRNHTGVTVMSLAEPITILMKYLAGMELNKFETDVLFNCSYDPGPEKVDLIAGFNNGVLPLDNSPVILRPRYQII